MHARRVVQVAAVARTRPGEAVDHVIHTRERSHLEWSLTDCEGYLIWENSV